MKILIADDDITSRTMLSGILRKHGYETLTAKDGGEALEIMNQPDAPKMAVLDWIMPVMDGIEICRQMRSAQTDNPPYLILLTSRDTKEDIVSGLDAGANDYLSKPYNNEELIARIRVGKRMLEIQDQLSEKLDELKEAMAQIRTLRGIVPMLQLQENKG
jgi:DNA-binding response OmpR family regulator